MLRSTVCQGRAFGSKGQVKTFRAQQGKLKLLVGGLEHEFYPPYIGNNHPN